MASTSSKTSLRSQILVSPLSAAIVTDKSAARASAWSGLSSCKILNHESAGELHGCSRTPGRQELLLFHETSVLMTLQSGLVGSCAGSSCRGGADGLPSRVTVIFLAINSLTLEWRGLIGGVLIRQKTWQIGITRKTGSDDPVSTETVSEAQVTAFGREKT
ncbi:hypothetical protein CRG98_035339 [Punica granatum]|uniref:Uncharacterized protein n=1 Tax=Punica granatum TaxID=22663 RepID=A0A2I0IJV0_PUNGR|nr:hypothetical protein CRG98_035339 [Punica granatum]